MDTNPYQPPVVQDPLPGKLHTPAVGIDGKYLVVTPGAVLPQRCVKTNQKITEGEMKRKAFEWCSPWVALSFLISGCFTIILYFVFRKKCEIVFGVHATVSAKYRNRLIFKLLATVGLFVAMPFVAAIDNSALIAATIILFIIAFISLFVGNSPLSVAKHRQGQFWIKGCCQEFLEQIGRGQPFAFEPGFNPQEPTKG